MVNPNKLLLPFAFGFDLNQFILFAFFLDDFAEFYEFLFVGDLLDKGFERNIEFGFDLMDKFAHEDIFFLIFFPRWKIIFTSIKSYVSRT